MKYIYSVVIFLIFLYLTTNLIDFTYNQDVENIDLNGNKISKIVVDVENANLALSTTVDKDIKIEHVYSDEATPTSNLYTYQDGETLFVNEYPYNNTNLITKKETIDIYIPEEYEFDEIDIETQSGRVNIDSINVGNLKIKSQSGNVDLANINADTIILRGKQYGITLNNVIAKRLDSKLEKTQLDIINSIIKHVDISNELNSTVNISKLVADKVNVEGALTTVKLVLSDNLNYQISSVKPVGNPKFTTTDDGFEYIADENAKVVVYNLSDIESVEVTLETTVVDDDDE